MSFISKLKYLMNFRTGSPPSRNLSTDSIQAADAASPLEILAAEISANASLLSSYLRKENHAQPSFERDAPTSVLSPSAPDDIKAARQALIDSSLRAFELARGPCEYIPTLAMGYTNITVLQWLTHFNIFYLVPLEGSISYKNLSETAKVPMRQLRRIAGIAMTSHLFIEPKPGFIAHSATSALFVTNSNINGWANFLCEFSVPIASRLVEASEKWPGSTSKSETAFNIAFNTPLPFFDLLATLPDKTKQFAGYMKHITNSEGMAIDHLVNGFHWASLGKATIVDVGGSSGNASIALAKKFPDLNFIVQDLPENASAGQALVEDQGPEIASRIKFQGHDFFQKQPVKGAQVYLLRMILHDWPDREAICITKNLVAALSPSSRILIMDSILPTPGTLPPSIERQIRARDLSMMSVFNSLERDIDDWKKLLQDTDGRLQLTNVVRPMNSVLSVLEVACQ